MTAQDWAEERAERVHKEMNDYEPGHPQPCSDCRIITAALIEAEARHLEACTLYDDAKAEARAEGERSGREADDALFRELVDWINSPEVKGEATMAWVHGFTVGVGFSDKAGDMWKRVKDRALRGKP